MSNLLFLPTSKTPVYGVMLSLAMTIKTDAFRHARVHWVSDWKCDHYGYSFSMSGS